MKVIAIDGPAGSGKSTIARHVAARLGLDYLDTGAMYRAVTFGVLRAGIDPADAVAVADHAAAIDLVYDDGALKVDGVDATDAIRSIEVTRAVSRVAANAAVRAVLVDRQQAWVSEHGGGVVEGRDIATVVFPNADLKVYVTARDDVRAARRAGQIAGSDVAEVAADIAARDRADSTRAASPLARAADAVEVDNSDRSIDEVVDEIVGLIG